MSTICPLTDVYELVYNIRCYKALIINCDYKGCPVSLRKIQFVGVFLKCHSEPVRTLVWESVICIAGAKGLVCCSKEVFADE